jgi:hypothetical protein
MRKIQGTDAAPPDADATINPASTTPAKGARK